MRLAGPLVLLVLFGIGSVSGAAPPLVDGQIDFVTNIEKAKAHLLISEELYAAGDPAKAALHSSHPVQELGGRLIGPIKKVDGALADRVRALLKKPRQAIDAKVPRPQYTALVSEVSGSLDEAVTRVVSTDPRGRARLRARVIDRLLETVVEDYQEALKSGKIAQVVEYQDAYGFLRRAHALYRDIAGSVPESTGADFAALTRGFPGVTPPPLPLPVRRVKELVARIGTSLTTVAGN
jgi:hypothetical protein